MKSQIDRAGASETPGEITTVSVLRGRLSRAFIGPAALLLTTCCIIDLGTGWLTAFDAFFAGVVGLVLIGKGLSP